MPSYYARNLCSCAGDLTPAEEQNRIRGVTRIAGGLEVFRVATTTVSKTEATIDESTTAVALKGSGNLRKKGSGGASYAAYLARKAGKIACC
jgi:hypothetical protein